MKKLYNVPQIQAEKIEDVVIMSGSNEKPNPDKKPGHGYGDNNHEHKHKGLNEIDDEDEVPETVFEW